ncbi:putative peptidase family-domain-containing protein [Podospora australis]|uniref:Peptidase family-domain-containing protein n=1 Tax=Podospora australis TaxID=1536484 RepID=A0AAN6WPX0_9PEZI|nr:putative peptidase family-domain-containing protein [Podospora australis]
MFQLHNFNTDTIEQVHQRCVLITGTCTSKSNHVSVETQARRGVPAFPPTQWPTSNGYFSALILLAQGLNTIVFMAGSNDGDDGDDHSPDKIELRLRYMPLPKTTPPLHLAILVAKDSPLLIDCPPVKFGNISSTHSSLDAAIAKFRVTALMWQTAVAEDMRKNGLGRRSFRLDETLAIDTLTRKSTQSTPASDSLNWVPQVHLVRGAMTVAALRTMRTDELHDVFLKALKRYGGPFTTESKPVVAGLVLDSHYNPQKNRVLASADHGTHDPNGLSLGMYGSHHTYAWPRFVDEIPDCLLDSRPIDNSVWNDQGHGHAIRDACARSQTAFLRNVACAFGAHASKSVKSQVWHKRFLCRIPNSLDDDVKLIEYDSSDWDTISIWDIADVLNFRTHQPHLHLPGDEVLPKDAPTVEITGTVKNVTITIRCASKLARVIFDQKTNLANLSYFNDSVAEIVYDHEYIEKHLNKYWALKIEVLGMNGVTHVVENVWEHLPALTTITIPGTNGVTLHKQSVGPRSNVSPDGGGIYNGHWTAWTVMLRKPHPTRKKKFIRATKLALHIGDALDGARVYYSDNSVVSYGRCSRCGHKGHIGGHQTRRVFLNKGTEITKVAVTRARDGDQSRWPLRGLRVWFSDGKAIGAMNLKSANTKDDSFVEYLTPPAGHVVVGLYGHHGPSAWLTTEFGIITAKREDVERWPRKVYDVEAWEGKVDEGEKQQEAKNEGEAHRKKRRRVSQERVSYPLHSVPVGCGN